MSIISSSTHYNPLLDIGLFLPPRSVFGYSHPAASSHSAQIVTPPSLRASYTTFTETQSPLQNSFTPAVVGSTADMASPLPLQRANTVCYVGDFSSLPDHRRAIARWATLNLWTSRAVSVHVSAPYVNRYKENVYFNCSSYCSLT
jgi:hypothetical protein